MQITYSNDPDKGPGHGLLKLSQSELGAGPLGLCITRASDQNYLSGSGQWLAEKATLRENAFASPDGVLSIAIGPNIVNALDPQEQYRLEASDAGGKSAQGRFRVENVIYSAAQNLENTASAKFSPEPSAKAPDLSQPKPEPDLPKPEADLPKAEISPPEAEKAPSPQPEKKNNLLRWLIIALLALACAGWIGFEQFKKPASAPAKTASEQRESPETSKPRTAEEEVRLFFSGKELNAKAAAELSRRLPKNSQAEQDAVYRLYYFAAGQEEPSVYLDFAACLDPAKSPWGSIGKDAPQAWEIYGKALANPDYAAKAKEGREALKAWLEKEAANGNAQAKIWLGQIQR